MIANQFKEIRERLNFTQEEMAKILGLSGKKPISHYETGERTPSPMICAFMFYIDSLSERKCQNFLEEFEGHMKRASNATKVRKRE